jgi:MFS family permease
MVQKESTYKSLSNLKGAKNLIFFGYLGRAPYAMLQVGMVIFGNYKTGSYAIGGAMAAGFSISNALIQPVNGRLVDKLGQKKVVSFLLGGFTISSLLITIGQFDIRAIYILLSVMLGITVPNIGAYTRRNWKVITEEKDNQKVQAIESSIDELNFLVGPSVFATVSNYINPIVALYIAIISSVVGTLGVVFSKTIEVTSIEENNAKNNSIWISKNKLILLATLIFVGACLSSISVYVVAKEDLENIKNLTAFYYLINGSTALISALFYGYYFSNTKSLKNYNIVLIFLAISVSLFFFVNSTSLTLLVGFICGLGIGPIFLLANSYISNVTTNDILTEAYSWLASSVGLGLALGSSLFGYLIDTNSLNTAKNLFLIFAICPLILLPFNKGWNDNTKNKH